MMVWLLGVGLAVSILIVSTRLQKWERTAAELAAGLLLASLPFVWIVFQDLPLILLAATAHAWLLLLPARLTLGRLERPFLHGSTQQNALIGVSVLAACALLQAWRPTEIAQTSLVLWMTASVCIGLFFLGQLWWNTRRYRLHAPTDSLPLSRLPTVSVCIPARNEDHALVECLTSVLASTYPKLEVLVLDDCSQDATSTIIRSFAHDGVRFIQGDTPADGWLGKNQALDTLAAHASGDYLLFMDVDTHLAPHSIEHLVHYSLTHGLEMTSVLPQSRLGVSAATTFGTLEYFWRLVLPITPKRAPVSSKLWMITKSSLIHLGGFASVSRKIVPEESFARRLASSQMYRFLVSNAAFGVTTAKRWNSQVETSIRLMYPRLQRQPMGVYGLCAALIALFVAPFMVLAVCSALGLTGPVFWVSLAAVVLLLLNYLLVLARVQPKNWFVAAFAWPIVVVQDFALLVTSMLQYEFGEVNWKGRNVCYPVVAVGRLAYVPRQTKR